MTLNGLCLDVILGWPEDEREQRQTVTVDISLIFSTPPAGCETDQLADTVCYRSLAEAVQASVANTPFRLLENLAAVIHNTVKNFINDSTIRSEVRITKMPPIAGLTGGVSFVCTK